MEQDAPLLMVEKKNYNEGKFILRKKQVSSNGRSFMSFGDVYMGGFAVLLMLTFLRQGMWSKQSS